MPRNAKITDFLKECMADGFIKLLAEKNPEQITVADIVNSAGVSRATYFRNFQNKNELLVFKLTTLWHRWTDEHNVAERNNFIFDNAETFFNFNYSIKNILTIIYKAGLQSTLYESFNMTMTPDSESDFIAHYKSKFFSYGLFGLLDEWIKRDFYEPPEKLTANIKNIIEP